MPIYKSGPLASMSGLPEPLVAALLRLRKYQQMVEDELVTNLLDLNSAIGDMDHSLIVSIVSECEASQKGDDIEKRLRSFAEDMRKGKEHAKLVLLTQQKQAEDTAAAQAHAQTRPTYVHSPQGQPNQPQWGQSQPEERPFYSVLPTSRDPVARTKSPPPQQQAAPVTRQQETNAGTSSPQTAQPPSTNPTEVADQSSLSASKSGKPGWLSWFTGSKNSSAKVPEEAVDGRKKEPPTQQAPSPAPKHEEEKMLSSSADNQLHTPIESLPDIKEKHDESDPYRNSSTPPSSSPSRPGPIEVPVVSSSATAMFGNAAATPQDSPSYGIAAIQPRPDLFGVEHLDDRAANRFDDNHFDPMVVTPTPLGAPVVSFGAPNSGPSNSEQKDSEVIFEDVFNAFLSKEQI